MWNKSGVEKHRPKAAVTSIKNESEENREKNAEKTEIVLTAYKHET